MAKDLLKETIKYNNRDVEAIRVVFALAFNLNLSAIYAADISLLNPPSYTVGGVQAPYFCMNMDYKTYFLTIDKNMNIAGYDSINATYPTELRPISNQIKIALLLINNNLIDDLVKSNLDVI